VRVCVFVRVCMGVCVGVGVCLLGPVPKCATTQVPQ
jgi:hypothetical protein